MGNWVITDRSLELVCWLSHRRIPSLGAPRPLEKELMRMEKKQREARVLPPSEP